MNPLPIETTDPDFAELLLWVTKQDKKVIVENDEVYQHNGIRYEQVRLPDRNDPCICGSGKKFKKCCME